MGRKSKQTLLQRRHTDGQKAGEKMLNVTTYQKNANQNYSEVSPHTGSRMTIIKKSTPGFLHCRQMLYQLSHTLRFDRKQQNYVKTIILQKEKRLQQMLQKVQRKGTLLHSWWECKLVLLLWRTVWRFLKQLKIELSYDPAISFLGIYLEKP